MNEAHRTHRVVVIGSGFGGLFAVKELRRAPVDVTVISRTAYHLFQPLLYQVATGILSEGSIAPATRAVLRRQRNAGVLTGDVTRIDLADRTVTSVLAGQVTVTPYDSLIVAAGSGQSYFGHDAFAEHAPGMKSIDDALALRGRLFGAFELAEAETDPALIRRWQTFVVIGGGPTGVEVAGQIAELTRRSLPGEFRTIDPARSRVVLYEAGPEILAGFGERLSEKAARELERVGVEVRTDTKVVGVDATGVDILAADGTRSRVEAMTKVWAAGVAASSLGGQLADQCGTEVDHAGRVEVDHAGRVEVEPDCSLPGHPEVFVVGDMMCLDHLPGVAQVAMQSGRHAAEEIRRRLGGEPAGRPFRYRDKGSMAIVARFSAVASVGRLRLAGFPAWLMWLLIHLLYLVGFRNRLASLLDWAVAFGAGGRSERTVTRSAIRGLDSSTPPR
ncbi:MAG TPA: NAD(P)/FAD-dependent oxidoreductase [Streptosporangiaceae bacterium]